MQELLSEITLARRLNCHPRTLLRLRQKGLLPYVRVGGLVRYDAEAVLQALPSFAVEPPSSATAREEAP